MSQVEHPSKRGIADGTVDLAIAKATIDCILCAEEGEKKVRG